jgi:hypothetical protein
LDPAAGAERDVRRNVPRDDGGQRQRFTVRVVVACGKRYQCDIVRDGRGWNERRKEGRRERSDDDLDVIAAISGGRKAILELWRWRQKGRHFDWGSFLLLVIVWRLRNESGHGGKRDGSALACTIRTDR